MNVTFYIATKRKNGFQENLIVGKDGMKSLSWAKQCLMNFINNNIWKNFLKGKVLLVYPANNRLRRIYERSLIPIGFKVAKNKDKPLYLKLIRNICYLSCYLFSVQETAHIVIQLLQKDNM